LCRGSRRRDHKAAAKAKEAAEAEETKKSLQMAKPAVVPKHVKGKVTKAPVFAPLPPPPHVIQRDAVSAGSSVLGNAKRSRHFQSLKIYTYLCL
jgi:hypothetical protein